MEFLSSILITFLDKIESFLTSVTVVKIDTSLLYFLAEHRSVSLTNFFLLVTFFGKGVIVTCIGIIFSLYLFYKKQTRYIFPFFVTLAGSGLTVSIIKLLVHRARPANDVAYYTENSFSFPSGHSSASVALYGYIAYYFIRKLLTQGKRSVVGCVAVIMILLIGLSRLYLGVHYFSDVVGGYIVGMIWLLIGIVITEAVWFRWNERD